MSLGFNPLGPSSTEIYMPDSSESLHVAFIADQAYIVGLAAAVQSVLAALSTFSTPAVIWIVDFGLTQEATRGLQLLFEQSRSPGWPQSPTGFQNLGSKEDNRKTQDGEAGEALTHMVDLRLVKPNAASVGSDWVLPSAMGYAASVTWAKVFLPSLLPSEAQDKHGLLLYLDSDTIVTPGTDLLDLLKSNPQVCKNSCFILSGKCQL